MAEIERFDGSIAWSDVSVVERRRTPGWAIQLDIQCHLAGISLRDASQHLERLGVERSHVAIHEWVHKADRQPISTVTADQVAVEEKLIRVNGAEHWLYGAVDSETNEIIHLSLVPSTRKRTTRWFLAELHRRCQLGDRLAGRPHAGFDVVGQIVGDPVVFPRKVDEVGKQQSLSNRYS